MGSAFFYWLHTRRFVFFLSWFGRVENFISLSRMTPLFPAFVERVVNGPPTAVESSADSVP